MTPIAAAPDMPPRVARSSMSGADQPWSVNDLANLVREEMGAPEHPIIITGAKRGGPCLLGSFEAGPRLLNRKNRFHCPRACAGCAPGHASMGHARRCHLPDRDREEPAVELAPESAAVAAAVSDGGGSEFIAAPRSERLRISSVFGPTGGPKESRAKAVILGSTFGFLAPPAHRRWRRLLLPR